MELAVFAGVVERDVAVGALLAGVDFTGVERLGIYVDAYGALVEFGKIQDLMDRLERIHVDGMGAVHFVDFCGDDFAGATARVFFVNAEILNFQAPDGGGHPAVLIAMIMDAAVLAYFPADGHALEEVIFENEIARVVSLGEEKVFVERLGFNGVLDDVVLDNFEREVALGDSGEAFNPVGDGELLDSELFWHGRKIITPKRSR
jgi:hypothetical protein